MPPGRSSGRAVRGLGRTPAYRLLTQAARGVFLRRRRALGSVGQAAWLCPPTAVFSTVSLLPFYARSDAIDPRRPLRCCDASDGGIPDAAVTPKTLTTSVS